MNIDPYKDPTPDIKRALITFKEMIDEDGGDLTYSVLQEGIELIKQLLKEETARCAERERIGRRWEQFPDGMGS